MEKYNWVAFTKRYNIKYSVIFFYSWVFNRKQQVLYFILEQKTFKEVEKKNLSFFHEYGTDKLFQW